MYKWVNYFPFVDFLGGKDLENVWKSAKINWWMIIAPSNGHFDGIPHFQTQRVAGNRSLSWTNSWKFQSQTSLVVPNTPGKRVVNCINIKGYKGKFTDSPPCGYHMLSCRWLEHPCEDSCGPIYTASDSTFDHQLPSISMGQSWIPCKKDVVAFEKKKFISHNSYTYNHIWN